MAKPMIRYICHYKYGWIVESEEDKTLFIAGGFEDEERDDAQAIYKYFVSQGYQPYVKSRITIPTRVLELELMGVTH